MHSDDHSVDTAVRPPRPAAVVELPVVLEDGAVMPSRAHADDAGLDLTSSEDVELPPGGRALVGTGVRVALPEGTVGLVCPRSGLAARHGVTVLNGPGVVDAGYRGELRVALINTDQRVGATIRRGDRIAQLLVMPVLLPQPTAVAELTETTRAAAGFGSTGTLAATEVH
ncbi:dUTP diphosphatase [Brachybacterium sp. EF45031]|uniref:dUTP diphosphatase n=1 Tax=Brachybacterium sillae TaxID=2810536 RepID=UPI00217D497C|nr:dUTP diphosphatase [Brachybacterium sillae]MCS6710514.1 dUTP diphosphatase [Brachybacterium sillae]